MSPKRTESDFLGQVEIPSIAYFGVNTARTVENLSVSGVRQPIEMTIAMTQVKKACAIANTELECLAVSKGNAIVKACDAVLAGAHSSQFIVDVFCGGGGALLNMNVNEVIANCAIEILGGRKGDYSLISPFNDVNMSQGDFDVFSTAARIALRLQSQKLLPALNEMKSAFLKKSLEFDFLLKPGRASGRDSGPITLGQEFLAFAEIIKKASEDVARYADRLLFVPIGGGETGNGSNTHRDFQDAAVAHLRDVTRLPLEKSENSVELTSFSYDFSAYSAQLRTLAANLIKICSDICVMSSGPKTGLSEVRLPEIQASSSGVPGKAAPLLPETLTNAAIHLAAADSAVAMASSLASQNQSVYLPVAFYSLHFAVKVFTGAVSVFTAKCVSGIAADEKSLSENFEKSSGIAALIIHRAGYDAACSIAREAASSEKSVLQICLEKKLFSDDEIASMRSPRRITEPGTLFR